MAKKEENKKVGGVISINNVSEENIEEQIKNANKFSEEIVTAAAEKAEKEEKERQIEEFSRIKNKATYINLKSVLRTRRARAAEKAISAMRKGSLELLGKVSGGEFTARDYENALDKLLEETNKTIETADKEYDKLCKELQNKFPGAYCYDWDNPYRRIHQITL